MTFQERAAPLIERGFQVIPLEPKQKKPVAGMGVTRKSREQAQIDAWALAYPDANVAVCADETFLILDADDAIAVEAITGKLNTYTVQSSPGKAHYYFRQDPEWFQPARNLELGKIGSLRADNQYVVAAGSIHPKTGELYVVINDAPVAILHALVHHKLEIAAQEAEREIQGIVAHWNEGEPIPSGIRQTVLKHLAGKWQDGVISEEALCARLMAVNAHCVPPKPESEIARLAAWAMTKEPNRTSSVELIISGPKDNAGNVDPNDWHGLFHTYEDAINAPPLTWAIKGFLQEQGITFFSGLAGHGKTLLMLNTVKALLEGENLFGYSEFKPVLSRRVLYLIPESGLGPFIHRLKAFRLLDHVNHSKGGKLFFRTLSKDDLLGRDILKDPRLLRAAEGADVLLDTAVRFMSGDENSVGEHSRTFVDVLFALQKVARTVSGAHHSPKAFENNESISLESALRGSGDIGAMLATAWAVRQTNKQSTRIYIKNVKARDFEAMEPFEVEGRPWIDQAGSFRMTAEPGMARITIAPKAEKEEVVEARRMRANGATQEHIAETLRVSDRTVRRWEARGLLKPDIPVLRQ